MKNLKPASIFLFCSFFVLSIVPQVFAANVEVVGRVGTDALDSQGSSVIFTDAKSKQVVSQTTVDPSGIYSIAVPAGTYDISIVPPVQSHIPQITKTDQTITSDTAVNFALPNPPAQKPAGKNYSSVIVIVGVVAVIALVGFLVKW